MTNRFDRTFGATFLATLPEFAGVYRFYDDAGVLIYVGKAKNLRRRLAQYRNAKRRKKHAKMRSIVADAVRVEFETCADEFAALKLENEWIQAHRPKWNVAGAFYFLYPLIGVSRVDGELRLCYTTMPERFPEFRFYGAFRSRERTKDGFFALVELLRLIGHSAPTKRNKLPKDLPRGSTYLVGFRQIPAEWIGLLDSFFRGSAFDAIEELSLLLLDRPTAVARRAETQVLLRTIRLFWRHEAVALRRACLKTCWKGYPVAQQERDLLFIAFKSGADLTAASVVENLERTPDLVSC